MRRLGPIAFLLLAGCAGGPPVPDWQMNAAQAMAAFQQDYLVGDSAAADRDFLLALNQLKRTGREDLLAHAQLMRCAVRAAALEFDDCPGFEALRSGAAPADAAYAEYLAGKGTHAASDEPLSQLVARAVALRRGDIGAVDFSKAVDIASAQGWRRPLLAWLGVQAKRATDAGDAEAAARLRRRMDLIS
ncbi:MAG: hypothetical protein ACM30H_01800, partial [Clostridia bacterium]